MTDAAPVIAGTGLTRIHARREESVRALDGVNFAAHAGDLVAVVGRSGSGKSTLLTLLGLLDKPSAGRLFFKVRRSGRCAPERWRVCAGAVSAFCSRTAA